jgi:DNA-binding CsgD family transcriptional regulator
VPALFVLSAAELCCGRTQRGLDAAGEGLELISQLGDASDALAYYALRAWIDALLGNERECRDLAARATKLGLASGAGYAVNEAHLALCQLEAGLGNAAEAIAQFDEIDQSPLPPLAAMAVPELVDAAIRIGDAERARHAVERFAAWAPVSGTSIVDGMLARCRAMLEPDEARAEELFLEACRHHREHVVAYELGRSELAYGEYLRRARRRVEARVQLRRALETFEGIGTKLWAERARRELLATGETARKRDPTAIDELTPQELRVARLVAAGASNKDVAAQLFLSRRTVEYHLAKVFVKLGINSRMELARLELEPVLDSPPGPRLVALG